MNYCDLIGTRFKIHGRNKDEGFDCYGLAIEVLRRNGIILKDAFYKDLDTRETIREELHAIIPHEKIENPQINCIIELAVHGEPLHIAVYIGNGMIIHTTHRTGVVLEPLARYKHQILGCYKVSNS